MLVVTRKRGEEIHLHDGADLVIISVLRVRPDGGVRIGIQAKPKVSIKRAEICSHCYPRQRKESANEEVTTKDQPRTIVRKGKCAAMRR